MFHIVNIEELNYLLIKEILIHYSSDIKKRISHSKENIFTKKKNTKYKHKLEIPLKVR